MTLMDRPGSVSITGNTETQGTGDHQHRRGRLEHDGIAVGFWVCRLGTNELHSCPAEPDPWEALTTKWAKAVAERPPSPIHVRERCRYGHGAAFQRLNVQGHPYCQECNRLSNLKSRMKRAARSIVAAALAA